LQDYGVFRSFAKEIIEKAHDLHLKNKFVV
jgi:hypothetical protein